jgi:hypothetical protein
MDDEQVKRRQRELSKQQAIYVANRTKGLPKEQSALIAGYKGAENGGGVAQAIEASPAVQQALAIIGGDTAKALGIKRADVAAGLLEAAALAKTMADPSAMVRALAELGKMLGFYAPEVKRHLHDVNPHSVREAISGMSDDELMRLARGRPIEGKVLDKKVENGEQPEPDRAPERESEGDEDPVV